MILDPFSADQAARPPAPPSRGARAFAALLAGFYADRSARMALLITAVIMCYGGGAVMFWFHAIYLGEGGPSISEPAHWLLDSSFAFGALTPVLAVVLPIAAWAAQRYAVGDARRFMPWLYAVIGGSAFAIVATPGPIAHDMFVGRGTWLAERVTELIGTPAAEVTPASVSEYPLLAALAQQLGAGLPLYVGLMVLTVALLRLTVRPPVPARRPPA